LLQIAETRLGLQTRPRRKFLATEARLHAQLDKTVFEPTRFHRYPPFRLMLGPPLKFSRKTEKSTAIAVG
jgi:hypothetical protein